MLKKIRQVPVLGLFCVALLAPGSANSKCKQPIEGRLSIKGDVLYFSGPVAQGEHSGAETRPTCSYRYHPERRRFVAAAPIKSMLTEVPLGLESILIDRPDLEALCELNLKQVKVGQALGVVSCNLWSQTHSLEVTLKHDSIMKTSLPKLGYDHLRRDETYWVSIVVPGGEIHDAIVGYAVFDRSGPARYRNQPLDCADHYGELFKYEKGILCQGDRGVWEWVNNGTVSQLPHPCSAPNQILVWDQQLWGLTQAQQLWGRTQEEDANNETLICRYDRLLTKTTQVFKFSVDMDATAPAVRGRISHWRAFHAEHDNGAWQGIMVYLLSPVEMTDANCRQLAVGSGDPKRGPCVGIVRDYYPMIVSKGDVRYLEAFPLPVEKLKMKMVRIDEIGR